MPGNMRMNKSGSMGSISPFTVVKVTGWVADASSPGTVITSDALVLSQSGTGITISGACAYTTSFGGATQAQLYKNGVAFGSTLSLSGLSNTYTWSFTGQAVTAGDTWDMRVNDSTGSTMTVIAAGTFLRVDGYPDLPRRTTPMHAVMRASLY